MVSLIREAISTTNVNEATYSITRIPPNATWGLGYQDKYLTTGSRQCKVRFAAKLENVAFFDRGGQGLDRVRVGMTFVTAVEEAAMQAFFQKWGCISKRCVYSSYFQRSLTRLITVEPKLWASRFQTATVRGMKGRTVSIWSPYGTQNVFLRCPQTVPFKEVYDAVAAHGLRKGGDGLIDASEIIEGDIVIVDAIPNRYKTDDDKRAGNSNTQWDKYTITFQLVALYRIWMGPGVGGSQ